MRLAWRLVRRGTGVILIASVLSSIGGVTVEAIGENLYVYLPFIILLPALNSLIGDFGTTVAARFKELLGAKGSGKAPWYDDAALGSLFATMLTVAVISMVYIIAISSVVAYLKGFVFTNAFFVRALLIALFVSMGLMTLIFWVAVGITKLYHSHQWDARDGLSAVVGSIADLCSSVTLVILIALMF